MRSTILATATVVLTLTIRAYGQYFGPVPPLNYPVSARSLGMGGVETAVMSDNAAAAIGNPAQLGLFSFNGTASLTTDLPNSLGSRDGGRNISFDASAVNLGLLLNTVWQKLPFKLAAGIGYDNVSSNYMPITLSNGPDIYGRETDASKGLSVGIGLDDLVKLGIGYTMKWIRSPHPDFPVDGTARDFGAMVQIPITKFISSSGSPSGPSTDAVRPFMTVNLGYAIRNVGGYTSGPYPLPREASLGWSADFGLESEVAKEEWEWLSVSWSNEAADHSFRVDSTESVLYYNGVGYDTTWNYYLLYKKGLGSFNPWQNLIAGKGSRTVGVRKGGQIGFGEFLYIRAGSITEWRQTTYSTFGWGVRLGGLVKLFVFMHWLDPGGSIAGFLLNHLDIQYDYGTAYGGIYGGKPFEDLNVVLR